MESRLTVRQHVVMLVALLVFVPLATANAAPFSALYAFGDSLSDTGNVATATGGAQPVSPPYDSLRFTSPGGPVAVERMAAVLGLSETASLLGGTDYAYGGARTGTAAFPAGLLTQVGMFDAMPGPADPTALYFVFAGGNDLRDAAANPAQAANILQQAATNVRTALDLLYGEGARSFFVPNYPNIGRTPEAIASGNPAGATQLSLLFNSLLANQLTAFAGSRPDASVIPFNTYLFLENLIANAGALGYVNTTQQCVLTPGCNPDEYVFWDGVHPTGRTHTLFGDAMAAAAVPEPATLTLLALGVIGAAARRHARRR